MAAPGLRHPFERALARTAVAGRVSLRTRILLLLATVNLACAAAAAVVTLLNAREATRVEIASSLDTASRLVRETVTRLERDMGRLRTISDVQGAVPPVRHARIVVRDALGAAIASREADASLKERASADAPRWFASLIEPAPSSISIPVLIRGERAGSVVVYGDAADEIAEVWEDIFSLALLFVVLNALALAVFAVLLGRVLSPLAKLADGMTDLRVGRLDRRLETPRSRELASIVERFNALGQALAAERATNGRMSWRMVTIQDDERRQIAKELHDELGPCLFGLRSNLASLERELLSGPHPVAPAAAERLDAMTELAERLSGMNRRLLGRLRPMALGAAPLAEVLAGLIADFKRHHPERRIELVTRELADSYGEAVDLTVYRAVQEGVTNAIRHAACARIAVTVELGRDERGASAVLIRILDDGGGVTEPAPAGFGLIGLGERLRALGGSFHLHNVPAGAALDVVVPLSHVQNNRLEPQSA
ncbi:histidine kinase [Chelatococcus sambhunathii]|nr:histidine kinase [Chelatococcus sambhunathii]